MVWFAAALLAAKEMGVCCCRPRVTLRPPESEVVVSQMLTGSLAAKADGATAIATAPAATAPAPAGAILNFLAEGRPRRRGCNGFASVGTADLPFSGSQETCGAPRATT